MGARKKKEETGHEFKFVIIQGEKYLTIMDILAVWPYCRKSIERFIQQGRLESRKWNGKRLVTYASFMAFEANG